MKKFMAVLAAAAVFAMAAPALAANPFADVPAGHWAYDAVAQLAADGLIAGYPDGSYKGAKTATRYEMAALVARAVARGDELHAGKQDLELIKKLVAEFKDELDAMGAKVNELDKRVGTIEKNIGAWKISGILKFDAKFINGDVKDDGNSMWSRNGDNDEFTKEHARLFLRKQIDKNTYFDSQYRLGGWAGGSNKGRGDISSHSWKLFYVATKLPYDIDMKVGRFVFNWEGEAGVWGDSISTFGQWRSDGFSLKKKWGNFSAEAVVLRNTEGDTRNYLFNVNSPDGLGDGDDSDQATYALNLKYKNDKFMLGGSLYYQDGDGGNSDGLHMETYAGYAGYTFKPGIDLKGIYYYQKYSDTPNGARVREWGAPGMVLDDDAKSWKVILDVKQSVLKYTSVWIEYHEEDNNFSGNNAVGVANQYSIGTHDEPSVLYNRPINNNTSKYWFIKANQKWGDTKWGSFIRFVRADFDTVGQDDATEWGIGLTYQYTPAIQFMLAYISIDFGDNNQFMGTSDGKIRNGDDNVIIFRTTVNF